MTPWCGFLQASGDLPSDFVPLLSECVTSKLLPSYNGIIAVVIARTVLLYWKPQRLLGQRKVVHPCGLEGFCNFDLFYPLSKNALSRRLGCVARERPRPTLR